MPSFAPDVNWNPENVTLLPEIIIDVCPFRYTLPEVSARTVTLLHNMVNDESLYVPAEKITVSPGTAFAISGRMLDDGVTKISRAKHDADEIINKIARRNKICFMLSLYNDFSLYNHFFNFTY